MTTVGSKSPSGAATTTKDKKVKPLEPAEIVSRGKALGKAMNNGEPAANIIAILQTLKDGVAPTEDLLRVCTIILMAPDRIRSCYGSLMLTQGDC